MLFIEYLGSKRQLRKYVFPVDRIAIEGVVFGRDIKAIQRLYVGVVIFYVKAVHLDRLSLNAVGLSVVFSRKDKALLGIVNHSALTK